MTIAVVVRQALGEDQRERLRQVVALAAGYNEQRGDAIVVSSMGDLVNTVSAGQAVAAPQQDHAAPVEAQPVSAARPRMGVVEALIAVLALVAALAALGWWRYSRSRQPVIPALDAGARQRLLADVRSWIDQGAPAGNQVERP
jgi:flagellar M-ring protein FliF